MNPSLTLKNLVLTCVLGSLFPLAGWASDYEEGLVHYANGRHEAALASLQVAAENAEPGAANLLARMYQSGLGTAKDSESAFQWTLVAAHQGVAQAQYQVAEIYADRSNIAHHVENSLFWYRAAARQGHHGAHYRLAKAYALGIGVDADQKQAQRLYDYASSRYLVFAEKGDPVSQNQLAHMYELGEGLNQDHKLAMNWYQKAAHSGFAEAQYNVGRMLNGGHAGEVNLAEAVYWLKKAAAQGLDKAHVLLSQVEQALSSQVALR